MSEPKIRMLEVAQVEPDPSQPRKEFPESYIADLAESIRVNGLLQPIVVRPAKVGGGEKTTYQIEVGECRWRAHKKLGWSHIRAIVQTGVSDEDKAKRSIIENVFRLDMKPMEEARGFQRMMDEFGYSIPRLVKELGFKTRARVSNRLDLLKLSSEHQTLVDSGAINASMACRIGQVEEPYQTQIVKRIVSGELKTAEDVMNAVCAIKQRDEQGDLVDPDHGKDEAGQARDVETVNRMEAKVELVIKMVATAFSDGECRIAEMVSRDRSQSMIDKLALCRKHILQMERKLGAALAQGALKLPKGKPAAAKKAA